MMILSSKPPIYFFFALAISLSLSTTTIATVAKKGMVVSEHRLASQVGADILAKGGNAIDAAVAVGYALAVVNPCCGNVGGGGFMTIHLANGTNTFLNFRERAPLKANKYMYGVKKSSEASVKGFLAVAVPGSVLGFDTILAKYGTKPRAMVMQPAIELAEKGFEISPYLAAQLKQYTAAFKQQPNVAAIFLNQDRAYKAGERLIQSDLANSLKLIAKNGASAFYQGAISQQIVAASDKHHGILGQKDFSQYTVEELTPLNCTYRGYTLISAPPPSSGGTALCEMLNILENFDLKDESYHKASTKRIIIEAMRRGFIDRNQLGDPDFVHNPVEEILSKPYAAKWSEEIKTSRIAIPPSIEIDLPTLSDTTHYSIVDSHGNAVSVTYTLNGFFGAGVIAGRTGFFLNNQMDDFSTVAGTANKFGLVQSNKNDVAPGKRPLSSMAPTIILKNNELLLVIGSPGGPRIITSVLLTLLNLFDFNMSLAKAIDQPRFHFQNIPNVVSLEPFAFNIFCSIRLQSWGYHLLTEGTWGAVEAILVDSKSHSMLGINDPRRPDGSAAGVN